MKMRCEYLAGERTNQTRVREILTIDTDEVLGDF